MRPIDADALIKSVQGYDDAGWLEEQVDKQPTVDAVEVVRCKDCIRRGERFMCPMMREPDDAYFGTATDETENEDYCSYGERKESVSKIDNTVDNRTY